MMARHVTFQGGKKAIVERPAEIVSEAERLERERSKMRCSPSSLRLALHRAGRLSDAEAIAKAEPEAAIVWEYMVTAERQSPLIEALKGDAFTDEEIDSLFRIAMEIDG